MTVTAAILCGGVGTRLRYVIGDAPKCLAPVAGRPFLFYLLDHLASQGVIRVVLCTGHKGDEVKQACDEYREEINIHCSREPEPLGTGGALRYALPLLDTDPVLVLNGDSFCGFDLKDLLGWYDSWGSVDLEAGSHSTGVRLLSREFIGGLSAEFSLEKQLEWLLNEGGLVTPESATPYHDIGTPERYAAAEEFLRGQGVIFG